MPILPPLWRRSILYRTALQVIGIALLVGLVFVILTLQVTNSRIQSQFAARLGELLETVDSTTRIACFTLDQTLATEVANGLIKNSEVLGVVIRTESELLSNNYKPSATPALLKQARVGRITRPIFSPFDPREVVGEILLDPDPETYDRLIQENVRFVALLLGLQLLAVVAAVLALVLLRVVRPIKAMSDQLHHMEVQSVTLLPIPLGHDQTEIGRLARDINLLNIRMVAARDEEHILLLKREADERKYHAIFDNADSGIFIASNDGCLDSWNHALGRQFRLRDGLAIDVNLNALNWRTPERLNALLQNCIDESRTQTEDFEFLPGEDTPRWFSITLTPIDNHRVQGLVNDISRRKQAEAEIQNVLARQQELNQLKTRFVSMTSHEFRTPLSAILSSAELVRNYYERLAPKEREELFDSIEYGVMRMTQMLDNILIIGQADADRMKCSPELLDIERFCHAIAAEAKSVIETGDTPPVVHLDIETHCDAIMLDQKLMRHILGNLLSNALKYSPNGGRIDFVVRSNEGETSFVIADQGIGIPADELPRLFESFHRAHNVGNIQGTGLGLAIVKKSVDAHGGQIFVNSGVGQGTRFMVSIPTSC